MPETGGGCLPIDRYQLNTYDLGEIDQVRSFEGLAEACVVGIACGQPRFGGDREIERVPRPPIAAVFQSPSAPSFGVPLYGVPHAHVPTKLYSLLRPG